MEHSSEGGESAEGSGEDIQTVFEPVIEMNVNLSNNLTQLVFSKIDFRTLFQTAFLAKEWRDNLLCPSFQRQMESNAASSWESYAPLYCDSNREIVGYDSSSKAFHRLPSHSFLPQDVFAGWTLRAGAGALLFWTSKSSLDNAHPEALIDDSFDINISNPLTKSWKQLKRRPVMDFPDSIHFFWEAGNASYKMIAGSIYEDKTSICVQIYNSLTDSWTGIRYLRVTRSAASWVGAAFKDGVVHIALSVRSETYETYKIVLYDVARKSCRKFDLLTDYWQEIHCFREIMEFGFGHRSSLLVCGSRLLLVTQNKFEEETYGQAGGIWVHELDLEDELAVEVGWAPQPMVREINANLVEVSSETSYVDVQFATSQDGCIYIGGSSPESSLLSYDPAYNVEIQKWDWLHRACSSTMDNPKLSFTGCLNKWEWVSTNYSPGINTFFRL